MLRTCSACGATNRIPATRVVEIGRCGKCKAALPVLTTPFDVPDVATFDALIAGAPVPVLVDFWAAWCGPCKMVAPEVARVAAERTGRLLVLKVNTETLPALATRYRVQGIPNFALFRSGALITQQAGAMRLTELLRFVDGAHASR